MPSAPSSRPHSPLSTTTSTAKATGTGAGASNRPRSAVERIIEKGMGLSKVSKLVDFFNRSTHLTVSSQHPSHTPFDTVIPPSFTPLPPLTLYSGQYRWFYHRYRPAARDGIRARSRARLSDWLSGCVKSWVEKRISSTAGLLLHAVYHTVPSMSLIAYLHVSLLPHAP